MSENWRQLVEHDIDILVCTTIIETGVDVPNVNTLIIENSDSFGHLCLQHMSGGPYTSVDEGLTTDMTGQ